MDQRHVGRLVVQQRLAGGTGVGAEGPLHAFVAEITGDRRLQVADADAGLPAAGGELRAGMALDENAGLDAFDRLGIARQRADDEGGAVDQQAERHGIDQRIGARIGK